MMRVHLRGVVIGVGTVLTIVLIVSVFNALDMPSDDDESVSRHALSTDNEETDAADKYVLFTPVLTPVSVFLFL